MTRLIAHRKAVSVFPLPVGARISVDSRRAIDGHPSVCGGVGASKEARNQSAAAGWKSSNTPARLATFTLSLDSLSLFSSFRHPSSVLYS